VPFFRVWSPASQHNPMVWQLLRRLTCLAPRRRANVGRHFRARAFVDVTHQRRCKPRRCESRYRVDEPGKVR
jgi:hypothetical protein